MSKLQEIEVPDTDSDALEEVGYPKKLTIVLSDRCNLKCFICQRDEYEKTIDGFGQHLDLGNLSHLDEAIKAAEFIDITGFGESFLHPDLEGFLNYVFALNTRENLIAGISNGTALSKKNAKLLRGHLRYLWISLNAANAKAYRRDMHPESNSLDFKGRPDPRVRFMTEDETEEFREKERRKTHGSFERVLSNIRVFLSEIEDYEREKVHLHYVVHRRNYHEMPDFVRLAKDLGISQVNFNQYMVTKPETIDDSIWWIKEDYNQALDEANEAGESLAVKVVGRKFFDETERLYDKEIDCQYPYTEALVGVGGLVNPCCHIGAGGIMGNAFEQGFDAVWFGEEYRKLRKERFKPGCLNCNLFLTFDDYRSHFHPHLKSTEHWKQIAQRFAAPSQRAALQVLVVGTGRDGSKSLARLIDALYRENGEPVVVRHEPESFPVYDRVMDYLKQDDTARLQDLFGADGPHVHVGSGLGFALPALRAVLGPETKVIHLKRDREPCIRSLANRLDLYPETWGGYADYRDLAGDEQPPRFQVMRPTAPLLSELEATDWQRLSPGQKLAWYYDKTHELVAEHIQLFPHHIEVRTEDLSSPESVRRIAALINPQWDNMPMPVHVQSSRLTQSRDPGVSHRERRKIEAVLSEFDLQKAVTSPAYPVVYFLAWLVSVHDKTPEAAAELPIKLHHIRRQIDHLIENAAAIAERARPSRAAGQNNGARRFELPGMSSEQNRTLEALFDEFDPTAMYTTDTYPVIYFLERLPAVHQGGSAGGIRPVYRWVGEAIDGLLREGAGSPG